jgi:LysM repeat protein
MDTISRENNSMLPVGAIIVGVIGLLLGGYSAIKLSSVNRTLAAHEEKIAQIDTLASQVSTSAAASDKATRDIASLTRSTQDAVTQIGNMLGEINGKIAKLEEAPKVSVKAAGGHAGGAPAVAGPDEYIVKSGDTGAKIARAKGVSLSDLQSVNPSVNWTHLAVGQKIKLPKK